jgi:hypothetical protein
MNDGKAAELSPDDVSQVDDRRQRFRSKATIDVIKVRREDQVDAAVVVHLESRHTDESARMGPQQVDECQRLGFVSGGARVELDGPGALLELESALGVESIEQVSD